VACERVQCVEHRAHGLHTVAQRGGLGQQPAGKETEAPTPPLAEAGQWED